MFSQDLSTSAPVPVERALAAAAAGAARLPVALQLTVADPVEPVWALPADAGGAVVATLGRGATGEVVIIVGEDLIATLRDSPLGELDLTPALQATLDAVAAALGGSAEAARQVDPQIAVEGDGWIVVPLQDGGGRHRATIAIHVDGFGPSSGRMYRSEPMTNNPSLELLRDVSMEVTVELGRTRLTVRDLLNLVPGSVVELDRAAGSPADVYVHGTLIARGEVVVVDEDFGIRITEIVATPRSGS